MNISFELASYIILGQYIPLVFEKIHFTYFLSPQGRFTQITETYFPSCVEVSLDVDLYLAMSAVLLFWCFWEEMLFKMSFCATQLNVIRLHLTLAKVRIFGTSCGWKPLRLIVFICVHFFVFWANQLLKPPVLVVTCGRRCVSWRNQMFPWDIAFSCGYLPFDPHSITSSFKMRINPSGHAGQWSRFFFFMLIVLSLSPRRNRVLTHSRLFEVRH